ACKSATAQRFSAHDDIDTIIALRGCSLSICYASDLNHLMRSGTHKRPNVRVSRFIGPQNRGATGRNAVKGRKNVLFLWRYPMLSIFRRLMKSEQGATAIEYTLIASL